MSTQSTRRSRVNTKTQILSYNAEVCNQLKRRITTLFVAGILASSVAIILVLYIYDKRILLQSSPLLSWLWPLYSLHPISIAVGLILLFTLRASSERFQILDFCVLEFNILLLIAMFAVFFPSDIPDAHIAVILLAHAAVIPGLVRYQVGLTLSSLIAYPLAQLLAYSMLPEIQTYWSQNGGLEALQGTLIAGTTAGILYGGLSIFITKSLYNMRLKLHEAQRLGNYVVDREIGAGGMGKVYLGSHALLCRPTAIKVLRPGQSQSYEELARFEREVTLSSTLTHPNTITVYDYGRADDDTFFYAMEYLPGMDLGKLIKKYGPLPYQRVIFILKQVCNALSEAHGKDIVHRDIKPSNIFITQQGGLCDFVKVLDFGLAKHITSDTSPQLSATGLIFGTPHYISPEAARGAKFIDSRSDIYSLGAVAYWMLTGQTPFTAENTVDLLIHHVSTTPQAPSARSEMAIPSTLDAIILRCLAKEPESRYQDVQELHNDLDKLSTENKWDQHQATEWWRLHINEPA